MELQKASTQHVNLPAPKAPRVLIEIDKGITEKTAIVRFRHEIPLLEEIHGEGKVSVVNDTDVEAQARHLRRAAINGKGPVIPTEVENESGEVVTEFRHYDPLDDPRAEYDRLTQAYGMHPEIEISIVEKVYGKYREGRFEAALRGSRFIAADASPMDEARTMNASQLRKRMDESKIKYDPAATTKQLRDTLLDALSGEIGKVAA